LPLGAIAHFEPFLLEKKQKRSVVKSICCGLLQLDFGLFDRKFAALQDVAKRIQGDRNLFTDQINYFDYQICKCILALDGLGFWIVP
jgi:hypothetical protein